MGRGEDGGVLPGRAHGLHGAARADKESFRAAPTSRASHRCAKSEERSSLASELSEHAATGFEPGDRRASRWNTHLRFALTTGLRSSAHSNDIINNKRGHF